MVNGVPVPQVVGIRLPDVREKVRIGFGNATVPSGNEVNRLVSGIEPVQRDPAVGRCHFPIPSQMDGAVEDDIGSAGQ